MLLLIMIGGGGGGDGEGEGNVRVGEWILITVKGSGWWGERKGQKNKGHRLLLTHVLLCVVTAL